MSQPTESRLLKRLVEVFEATDPKKPFVVSEQTLTYGELRDRAGRFITMLTERGVRPGDAIVLAIASDVETIALYFSSLFAGTVAVVVDPRATATELRTVVQHVGARAIFADPELLATAKGWLDPACVAIPVQAAVKKRSVFNRLLGGAAKEPVAEGYPGVLAQFTPAPLVARAASDESIAHILFTSGTTHSPKGVEISHRALAAHMQTLATHFGYGKDTRILNLLPLHHTDGLAQGPVVTAWAGATIHRRARFAITELRDVLDTIVRDRITSFVTTPTLLALILRFAEPDDDAFSGPDLRIIVSMASELGLEVWQAFEARFGKPVVNVYGLTETVSGSIFCGPTTETRKVGTIGKPVDCEIRVVDDAGADVAVGSPGELLLRGDHLMTGYHRNVEATNGMLRGGWLFTGDLAIVDPEGFVRIVGRKKNIVIVGGVNVQPEEVTRVLRQAPGVADAVTIGVADPIWGERVVSCVVATGGGELTSEAVLVHAREHLSPEKVPHQVLVVPDLPRGPSGKVMLDSVRAMVTEAGTSNGRVNVKDVEQTVYEISARCFRHPRALLSEQSAPRNTPGWDSLAHMELVTSLEQTFAVRFTPADILRLRSLGDVKDVVGELTASVSS